MNLAQGLVVVTAGIKVREHAIDSQAHVHVVVGSRRS